MPSVINVHFSQLVDHCCNIGMHLITLLNILFSLFSMALLGNAKNVVSSRCRLFINMTNGIKLSYYQGNTKT